MDALWEEGANGALGKQIEGEVAGSRVTCFFALQKFTLVHVIWLMPIPWCQTVTCFSEALPQSEKD